MVRLSALITLGILAQAASGGMVISEWMYNGAGTSGLGEFVEFTNAGPDAVDLTGWSFDDDSRTTGTVSLSAFGIVAAGESVILTDETAADFAANWGLSGVKIIGGNTAGLSRNDELNLYDAGGQLVDRLSYGDQNYAGTIRTLTRSCSVPSSGYAPTVVQTDWTLSTIGDASAAAISARGELGSPGRVAVSTPTDFDCDGHVDGNDLAVFSACFTGPSVTYAVLGTGCLLAPSSDGLLAADFDADGDVDQADFAVLQTCYSGAEHWALAACTCSHVTHPTAIFFAGENITVEGTGVIVTGTTATITSAGTYILQGTLHDGQVVVSSIGEGAVQLVLNGIDISSLTSAPFYIVAADEAEIVLAEGTDNHVSDPVAYVFEDASKDEPNAAVFSNDTLTISGMGALTIDGHYNDGITSEDELNITGGTIVVHALDDGIRGKDHLQITGGNITVAAGGDALKSDNAEDPDRGYVTIADGTFDLTSGGDGIVAETITTITGGTFTIVSGGGSTVTLPDTLSAKGIKGTAGVNISGGDFTINAADDAIHSADQVTIAGGVLRLTTGDEGISGVNSVHVTNGNTTIVAKNDGLKAENTAVTTQGSILIEGGALNITAGGDAITAQTTLDIATGAFTLKAGGGSTATLPDTASAKGAKGGTGVTITGGTFTINSADDGIHSGGPIAIENTATNIGITSGRDGVASETTVTIAGGTVGTTTGGGSSVTASDLISAKGIKGGTGVTITGGTITVNAADDGIHSDGSVSVPSGSPIATVTTAKDGIYGATVSINSGTFTVTTHGGSNYTVSDTLSAKGIKGETSVVIGGGSFTLNVAEDAIHCDANITISGGTVNISAADDGMHAETALTISNATVNITKCIEGLESATITINSGTITIVASDDGLNATKGGTSGGTEQNDGSWLYIHGGAVAITSTRDGLDSNGNIAITGGTVVVQGPPSAPEVAIDYNGTFTISGGVLVASGPNAGGMIQTPSTSSAQYTVKATGTLAASTFFHVQNASGTDIVTFKPIRSTYYLLCSASSLTTGVSYSIYTGGSYAGGSNFNGLYTGGTYSGGTLKKTFTLSSKVTSVSF